MTWFFFSLPPLLSCLWLTFNLFLRCREKTAWRLVPSELLMRLRSWFKGCLVCFWKKKRCRRRSRAIKGLLFTRQQHKQHWCQFHLLWPTTLLICLLILFSFQIRLIAAWLLLRLKQRNAHWCYLPHSTGSRTRKHLVWNRHLFKMFFSQWNQKNLPMWETHRNEAEFTQVNSVSAMAKKRVAIMHFTLTWTSMIKRHEMQNVWPCWSLNSWPSLCDSNHTTNDSLF